MVYTGIHSQCFIVYRFEQMYDDMNHFVLPLVITTHYNPWQLLSFFFFFVSTALISYNVIQ